MSATPISVIVPFRSGAGLYRKLAAFIMTGVDWKLALPQACVSERNKLNTLARAVIVSLFCAALLWTTNTFATIVSTFNVDAEGWRDLTYTNLGVFDSDNGLANFDGAFGNPSGSIDTTDPGGSFAARFGAPAAYLGNLSLFIGGTITFQLIIKAMPGVISLPSVPGVVAFENSAINRGIGYTGPLPNAATWTTNAPQ